MNLFDKVLNYLYLPVTVIITAVFLITNGLAAWLELIYLVLGLLFGWFLISVYLGLLKNPKISIIFSSAIFQVGFLLFSFWVITSNESLVASGIVLGINIFFVRDLVFDYQKRRTILKKKLFNNPETSDRLVLVYLASFILLVALLAFFVIF